MLARSVRQIQTEVSQLRLNPPTSDSRRLGRAGAGANSLDVADLGGGVELDSAAPLESIVNL